MAKRRGLGKGLDTLIPNKAKKSDAPLSDRREFAAEGHSRGEQVRDLPLHRVEPDKSQPRKHFDEASLRELTASIKEHGVITPILVQKKDGYYEIIAGERRWRAAKAAGLTSIPAIVKNYEDEERLAISLIENIQREDLDAIEEAHAFKRLIDDYGLTQEGLSRQISRSRPAISNSLRLLTLDKKVQSMVIEGKLSAGHARALAALDDKSRQVALAEAAAEKGLSVREMERLSGQEASGGKKRPARRKNADPYLADMAEKMSEALGTKVTVRSQAKGRGKIEIDYYAEEELDRLYEQIRHSQL